MVKSEQKRAPYKIPRLTSNEIQTLQTDAAMRMMGQLTNTIITINKELGCALYDLGNARIEVEKLKSDKQTVIELMRAIKVLVHAA